MPSKTSFTYTLTAEQQARLVAFLRDGNYEPVSQPYTRIAVRTKDVGISLFTSGKCLVQGKGAEDFVLFVMEPEILQQASHGYTDVLDPEASAPHMGIDESGKGDFFGPLVIAAVYTDAALTEAMRKLDVRDSKKITSDRVAVDLGCALRQLLGRRFSVVRIGPRAYNRLYAKIRNVNRLLAWGHARAIENLLESVPDCPRAISDQFGNERDVKRALMAKGRKIELVQRHRAESDVAVAAASILAREGFLTALAEQGRQLGLTLPKGASPAVKAAAGELLSKNPPTILLDIAKCHFKTADDVLTAAGRSRKDLGPEGQATSAAAASGRPFRRAPQSTG